MGIIIAIVVVGFCIFIALGFYGNAKQNGYETQALKEIAQKGLNFTKQTKTDYGIIGIDEPQNKLIIVYSEITKRKWEEIPYQDIFSCDLSIDGQTVYKKSSLRTVGGTLIGGALAGGVGAVVGGLSGSYKENKNIKKIELKIVTKSRLNTIHSFKFFAEGTNAAFLKTRMGQAEDWKNTVSIIIDEIDAKAN